MNAVGIDIGASTHAVALCQDGTLTARRKVLRVSQTREGFDELDRWLAGQGEISRVVLESSGHYWMPLVSHLRARDLPVALVNPVGPKYFAKRRLERAKSDPVDARTLAALGMVDQPAVGDPLSGAELREAARFAMRLVEEQSRVCQRIGRLIDLGFPELRQGLGRPHLRERSGGAAHRPDRARRGPQARRDPRPGEPGPRAAGDRPR